MKKYILTLVFATMCLVVSAQVGVGTANPETSLHVVGANATGTTNTPGTLTSTDGITVPIVTTDMTSTSTPGTKISQMVYSNNLASTGYYFWSGSAWNLMGGTTEIEINYGTDTVAIDAQVSAQLDISTSLSNYFIITNGVPSSGYESDPILTLPDPATNAGRIIIIDATNDVGTYAFTDLVGRGGSLLSNREGRCTPESLVKLMSTGTGWSLVTNN